VPGWVGNVHGGNILLRERGLRHRGAEIRISDFSGRSDYPPTYSPRFCLRGKRLRASVDK
jgi:hypothetical protein